ncbi:Aminopyrimidine aminohydrolase [Candidatus Kinetoplastibacterium sorsogonicusi]|uniref:Aminopyrimidine aminohydrolase n=1 Tax=Candidatus Kinetoplastidibacterium kentomonadis TaxID=1576550 RepID=A0A3Q8EUH6_9PROT|nr:TenA family protein [Candidatus Kinetoplastibacterium sorsogonicusi]AWD32680.1 Aminopyrimidine aminohydrolase [Candidatus Kinetoplastibacterium sorsogonicusi]
MLFSEKAWNKNLDTYSKIINLPFNQELMKGTLCINKFKNYIIQDAHYLNFFCKTLSLLSSKSHSIEANIVLLNAAKYVIEEEKILHKNFFKFFNLEEKNILEIPISPTCHHYGHFLMNLASNFNYNIAISAILPCFKIYSEISKYFYDKVNKTNPYYQWIISYSSDKFDEQVQKIEELINNIEKNSTYEISIEMHKYYKTAFYLEYLFWNSAYIIEKW